MTEIDAEFLREQAQCLRRLALEAKSERARTALLSLAASYEDRAVADASDALAGVVLKALRLFTFNMQHLVGLNISVAEIGSQSGCRRRPR